MKSKVFSLFIALVASVGTIFATGVEINGIYYSLNKSNRTARVVSSPTGYSGNITIPKWVYDDISYQVLDIASYAFEDCTSLLSVSFSGTIYIDDYAFKGCSNLESLSFGENVVVVTIKEHAFDDCISLTSIFWNADFYDNVNSDQLFSNYYNSSKSPFDPICSQITSFVFGEDADAIPAGLCRGMTNLISVALPEGISEIGGGAFSNCSSLQAINVAEENPIYTSIDGAIYNKDMTSIVLCPSGRQGDFVIPNSVVTIYGGAFENCCFLTSVEIPNSVTSIEESGFYGCTSITSIVIPSSVQTIGFAAFYNCSSLSSITIGNNVIGSVLDGEETEEMIHDDTFYGCNIGEIHFTGNLEEWCLWCAKLSYIPSIISSNYALYLNEESVGDVIIPDIITDIADCTFDGCNNLTSVTIPNGVQTIGYRAFANCVNLTSVDLPNSITSIGKEAFRGCSSLPSIVIPESVIEFDNFYSPFIDCTSLESVTINSDVIMHRDFRYYENKDMLHLFGPQVKHYTMGGNVTEIGMFAFRRCTQLTTVEIGDNVSKIEWCSFYECDNLATVSIGKGITQIEGLAFQCPSIVSITCQATTPPEMGTNGGYNSDGSYDGVFAWENYINAKLYVPKGSIGLYKSALQWKDFYNILSIGGGEDVEIITDNSTDKKSSKIHQNGQILILLGDKTYTLQGQEVK
jgi:hypothetical protein